MHKSFIWANLEGTKSVQYQQFRILRRHNSNEQLSPSNLVLVSIMISNIYYRFHYQLGKMQTSNRAASESAEKEFKSTTFEIKPGTEWDRVSKLCDFNPKVRIL